MILRDSDGKIIFSACRALRQCGDALEAELRAMMEGLALALEWCQLPIIVETDSVEVAHMITARKRDISRFGHLVAEARTFSSSNRIVSVSKVSRSQNIASHELAKFGRLQDRTAVWLGSGPEEILHLILQDCNDIVI
jgi:ribonuclease HI